MADNDNLDVLGLFPEAIKNEEFQVFYQPKISLKNYRLEGAEALCRWKHGGEMIAPFRFIPALEAGQEICTLDFYMLEHVCQDIKRWLDEGKRVVRVSVNLSRRHFGNENLLKDIIGIINKYDFPKKYIEIELTETSTDVDFKELKEVVTGLVDAGIRTSIDDFGMGYSSLNLLRELPWDTLKIDRSLLPVTKDENSKIAVIMEHVIAMAHTLGIECIAEGVE
ncbi:MAG: EAL domain-containing protein, partial [Lachnospiraceae bacterium]|nr:EAL domain-containing protein [Lachnospiraceae bacterium]